MRRILPQPGGLKLAHAADVLREAAVRLFGLKETLSPNDREYLDLIDRVKLLTDGVLKRSEKGKGTGAQDDDEMAMLAKVVDEIYAWTADVEKSGTARSIADNDKNSKQLARYNKLLDDIYARLHIGATLEIRDILKKDHMPRDLPSSTLVIPKDLPLTDIPPNPTYLYGRDTQRTSAREALCRLLSAHIAVLGGGGMGKTTFAVTLLHEEAVVTRFGRYRIFVSCDGVTTAGGIVTLLLSVLHVAAQEGVTPLQALMVYLKSLRPYALLVLDNLESAWDTPERELVEALLTDLCNIPTLALIITMRGNRPPSGQRWLSFDPLEKLSLDDARSLFMDISDSCDDKLDELLGHLDGLPLAVTLMASLGMRTTGNTPSKLLQSYLNEKTSMVKTGTDTRLSSLEVSITVSLNCSTMQGNPDALQLLSLLSLLPDGVRDEELRSIFPELSGCEAAARVLRNVALVTYTNDVTRVLAPIRDFMRTKHAPTGPHVVAMRNYFIQLALSVEGYPQMQRAVANTVSREMANIQSVLTDALGSYADSKALLDAIRELGKFSLKTYVGDCTLLLREAISIYRVRTEGTATPGELTSDNNNHTHDGATLTERQHEARESTSAEQMDIVDVDIHCAVTHCVYVLGRTLGDRYQHSEATEVLHRAKAAYVDLENWSGAAHCLLRLANILFFQDKTEQAECLLNEAKERYTEVGNRLGVADCLQGLGNILRMQNKYEQAASLLSEAKQAFTDIGDRRGIANCLWSLGEILQMQDKYEQAASLLSEAKQAFTDIGDRLGVVDCLCNLGDILRLQGEYDEAASLLSQAKQAYTDIGHRRGVAGCLWSLGDILRLQDEYEEAASLLSEAKQAYTDIGNRRGVAHCLRSLGDILRMQDEYERATSLLSQAKQAYTDIGNRRGVAFCLWSLGETLRMQGEYEQAEVLITESRAAFADIGLGDQDGIALCASTLGRTRQAQGRLDEARTLYVEGKTVFEGLRQDAWVEWCDQLLNNLSELEAAHEREKQGRDRSSSPQSARRRFRKPKWFEVLKRRSRQQT